MISNEAPPSVICRCGISKKNKKKWGRASVIGGEEACHKVECLKYPA